MLKYQAFCVKGHTTKQLTMKTFGYSGKLHQCN